MTDTIRVGLAAGTMGAPATDTMAGYRAREAAGFDHILWADHVSFVDGSGGDGLLAAMRIVTATQRIGAYGGVYLLALRHPVVVARQLADLVAAAPGRLTFGIGVGGEDRHEIESCGVDPRTRGRRTDECLQVLRGLSSGEAFSFSGEFFELDDVVIAPACTPTPPIIVGGRSNAAVTRTARYGDGWLGIWNSPGRFAKVVQLCDEEAAVAERTDVQWQHAMQLWVGLGNHDDEARAYVAGAMEDFYGIDFARFERYTPSGSPTAIADFCRPYIEAGCRSFNLIPCHPDDAYAIDACAQVRDLLQR